MLNTRNDDGVEYLGDREIIAAPSMTDNQTWNNCPDCDKYWKEEESIPGIIHRVRKCDACKEK